MTPMTGMTTPSIFGDKHEGQMPDQLPIPMPTGKEEKVDTDTNVDMEDPYKAEMIAYRKARPVSLISAVASGLAIALALVLMCMGIRESLLVGCHRPVLMGKQELCSFDTHTTVMSSDSPSSPSCLSCYSCVLSHVRFWSPLL